MGARRGKVGEVSNLARQDGRRRRAGAERNAARILQAHPPPRCARPREVENLAYVARAAAGFSLGYFFAAGAGATGGFGFVIISNSSVRNGTTGRPSLLKRLHTGLSAHA